MLLIRNKNLRNTIKIAVPFVIIPVITILGTLAFDEKIRGIIEVSAIPSGAEVMDAGGNYVCPGFVDIHIHFRHGDG